MLSCVDSQITCQTANGGLRCSLERGWPQNDVGLFLCDRKGAICISSSSDHVPKAWPPGQDLPSRGTLRPAPVIPSRLPNLTTASERTAQDASNAAVSVSWSCTHRMSWTTTSPVLQCQRGCASKHLFNGSNGSVYARTRPLCERALRGPTKYRYNKLPSN